MSNRRMLLVLASFVALTLPVAASAQTARVEGMALQGDYIKDYTGIYTYPSQIPNVGNLVYGELGNLFTPPVTFDRSVGAIIGTLWEGRLGTWGVHLREQTPQLGQGDAFSQPAPGAGGFDPNTHTNESFDLMWGKKFGTTSFGLRLNRSFYEFESDIGGVVTDLEYDLAAPPGDPATANLSRNILGVGAGIGFEIDPTTMIEVAANWQSRTFTVIDPVAGVNAEEDGPSAYQVAARAMWQWEPNVMVVPVFKWYSYDLSTRDNIAATTLDNTLSGWQLGAAGNWSVGANDLFVLGLTFAQNKVEQEGPVFATTVIPGLATEITETFSPQLFAALETHVNSWLTLRFGANKGAYHKIKEENTADNAQVTDSPFTMRLGTGVKVGTLQLDAILNDVWPHAGPWFLSGATAGAMFPKVTATYSF
jgi:hypothetical protein